MLSRAGPPARLQKIPRDQADPERRHREVGGRATEQQERAGHEDVLLALGRDLCDQQPAGERDDQTRSGPSAQRATGQATENPWGIDASTSPLRRIGSTSSRSPTRVARDTG